MNEYVNYMAYPGIVPNVPAVSDVPAVPDVPLTGLSVLLHRVAMAGGFTAEQLLSRDRSAYVTFVRHVFCWYAVRNGHRHTEIAKIIGRHRTAVAHSEKVIEGFLGIKDRQTLCLINKLKNYHDPDKSR
jgi:hypothetical protein